MYRLAYIFSNPHHLQPVTMFKPTTYWERSTMRFHFSPSLPRLMKEKENSSRHSLIHSPLIFNMLIIHCVHKIILFIIHHGLWNVNVGGQMFQSNPECDLVDKWTLGGTWLIMNWTRGGQSTIAVIRVPNPPPQTGNQSTIAPAEVVRVPNPTQPNSTIEPAVCGGPLWQKQANSVIVKGPFGQTTLLCQILMKFNPPSLLRKKGNLP